MKLIVRPYRSSKANLIKTYKNKGLEKLQEECVASCFPFVIAYTLILEEVESQELEDQKEMLVKFYGITEISEQ